MHFKYHNIIIIELQPIVYAIETITRIARGRYPFWNCNYKRRVLFSARNCCGDSNTWSYVHVLIKRLPVHRCKCYLFAAKYPLRELYSPCFLYYRSNWSNIIILLDHLNFKILLYQSFLAITSSRNNHYSIIISYL